MRKLSILVILITFASISNIKAQDEQLRGKEKIKAAKVGLITNRLSLTEEQAKGFWAIYDEFDRKRSDIRKNIRQMTAESRNITTTDDKILADLKEVLSLKQKEVDLEKEYLSKFLKVINIRQISELYKTEQLFNQMLVKKLNKASDKFYKE
ncbi:Spy/CpxP family protein refolding chaperone [Arcicella sp. LKC2W]|uniref:Spy/CpxP family protein refolding chaperone n=1 Tax=Arcicella sp. LKC2W TaxID=2984198 RepID=UPI002B20A5E4|nr:Spy/CpxP family protein refolding chaperone [Arcicella sp. LKC2W]MEA5457560.1 Spy/CpxP family protein refolding chaperone [Arcicella sp. LKC2W]